MLNIAEGARLLSGSDKAKTLDYAIGCREVDKAATSVGLNVAQGNGRYSELDHRRFLEIAASSAVKATAYLDLYQQKGLAVGVEIAQGRELMSRVIAMLTKF